MRLTLLPCLRVIQGKVEDITLPKDIDHVDIIVSEWMGFALLYESMLDSVLRARDRFLRPGGIMAPSQSKMMLGLCEAGEIYKDRVGFWSDVYGNEMSPTVILSEHDLFCRIRLVCDGYQRPW